MPQIPFSPLLLFKPWQPSQKRDIQLRGKQRGPSAVARLHLDSSLSESQACCLHCPDSYLCNWLWVGEMRYHGAAAQLPATHSNWDLGAVHLVRCQEGLKLQLVRVTSIQQPNAASSEHYLKLSANAAFEVAQMWVTSPGVITEKRIE